MCLPRMKRVYPYPLILPSSLPPSSSRSLSIMLTSKRRLLQPLLSFFYFYIPCKLDRHILLKDHHHLHQLESKNNFKNSSIGLATATMMITVSMIGVIQLQQASAAKPINFASTPLSTGYSALTL